MNEPEVAVITPVISAPVAVSLPDVEMLALTFVSPIDSSPPIIWGE